MFTHEGVKWEKTTFGLEPRWTAEPNIDVVARIGRKHLLDNAILPSNVSFFAQGAFNKLFKIETKATDYLLRVSRPIYPRLKTESEVATIEFVRDNTSIPVPRVVAFDSDCHNELGFEWILMEKMPGGPLLRRWSQISWSAKEALVKQLAQYQAELFDIRVPCIGNVYGPEVPARKQTESASDDWALRHSAALGPLMSLVFFWGDHSAHEIAWGPFSHDYDWLATRVRYLLSNSKSTPDSSEDEDDLEEANLVKALAEKILRALRAVFSPSQSDDSEQCMLFHDDMSMQNILVDEDGAITAIVDWEGVSALPLWRACQFPRLLEGPARTEKPTHSPHSNDHGAITQHRKHQLEYEQTKLRKLFMEEMARIRVDWVAIMKRSTLKLDYEKAIHYCENSWNIITVRNWLDALDKGKAPCLVDELRKC